MLHWQLKFSEDRNDTDFTKYNSFELTESRIVASYDLDKRENIIARCDLFGENFYFIVLEFGPREEVVQWANDYVQLHKEERFIVLTHEYLTRDGKRLDDGFFHLLCNTTSSSPEELWQNLIKDNDNIICVLCGHNGFYSHLLSTNSNGRQVPQILFNLQYQENGGNGIIQLWEFPHNSAYVNISIYNTITREIINPLQITFKYIY